MITYNKQKKRSIHHRVTLKIKKGDDLLTRDALERTEHTKGLTLAFHSHRHKVGICVGCVVHIIGTVVIQFRLIQHGNGARGKNVLPTINIGITQSLVRIQCKVKGTDQLFGGGDRI